MAKDWPWHNYSGEQGRLRVGLDGSLVLAVDDDFYSGTLAPDAALDLARAILARHDPTEKVSARGPTVLEGQTPEPGAVYHTMIGPKDVIEQLERDLVRAAPNPEKKP